MFRTASRTCATWWRATCGSAARVRERRSDARTPVTGCASTPRCRPGHQPRDRRRTGQVGLEVEQVDEPGSDARRRRWWSGGCSLEPETHSNGKTIRWCQVDVGEEEPRGIVCGAHNFAAGDLVVVALPGAVLPGRFAIAARKTYGHVSDGMICSARELGIGDDHERHHRARAGRRPRSGDDARGCSASARRRARHRGRPRPRLLPVDPRRRPRGRRSASTCPFRDPALREPPRSRDDRGTPVARRRPARLRRLRRRDGRAASTRPRPRPRWIARRLQLAGMRPISLGRRRHQLRDARARPADPRLRRATGCRGRSSYAAPSRGRSSTTLDGDDRDARPRGPAHHRRRRPDRRSPA